MKVYSITPADVAKALGLPLGTVPVPTNCENYHFEHIRAMFAVGDEELKRGVTFGMMKDVFKSGVANAKFQTSYVLFVLSSLLCPTTKDVASTKFYPAVYDLTKISSYAWPQFVLDWLVKELTKFKNRDVKEVDNRKDAPGVSGCVLLLMLIYFDKEEMGMNVGTDGVPLIQSWTTNLILQRISKEENLELVDPIFTQFPQPRLLHPEAQKAYHTLQKSYLQQMQHIIIMDAALMAHVSETSEKIPSKGKDVSVMDSPLDDDACHVIPSSSTCTPNKAGKRVAEDEMDEDRISDFANFQNACDMPLYTPEHRMDDVVHSSMMVGKCGSQTGVAIDQHTLNMDEEVQVQQEVVDNQGKVDREGEQVEVEVHVDEGVVQEHALTRPSKKRGNRTVKHSKATRTPYVAEPEVKDSKFTKQENQVIEYVMKPARKNEDMMGLVCMDGMTFNPARSDLQNVFKERGPMSNLVMDSMIVWLMKEEQDKSEKTRGVPIPERHMFSSTFVGNLRRLKKLKNQKVLNERVDPDIIGYDLFLSILLATCEHWLCVVINLVDKRIDVLDSMNIKTNEKTLAIAEVVSALFNVLKRTRTMDYPWKNWIIHHPDVPQQKNIFDCGFYTLRFMEHWTGGRINTRDLEANMGIEMRMRLLVRFILSPHNKRRADVLKKCK
ncbi:hypothetical protein RHSIM_Rhsim10G0108400 [Rhododendron simsii]|uniref:Ubiquitin-like protease family profile domain-containing protein n=1 Tax=Rhododendron simsii TaxID=118357 RepID=A0A834GBB2_RHOSS|nr:hypothetical protein RHSIM_Rhsim10G0108400 [Rhododendron simsii]